MCLFNQFTYHFVFIQSIWVYIMNNFDPEYTEYYSGKHHFLIFG